MRFFIVAMVIGVLLSNACTMRFSPVEKPETLKKFFTQIEQYNQKVKQLKAKIDIKAQGVMGAFIHEQADVIVRAPNYFLWSLRSFFGPPNFIVASNGEFVTLYDFSGATQEPYQKIAINGESVFELFDFQFHPQSLIDLFLAKIPIQDAKNIEISESEHMLSISGELRDGWSMKSVFNVRDHHLLETKLVNRAMGMSYQATYSNFEEISRIYFPRSFVLFAKHGSQSMKLNIAHLEIELNGEPVKPTVFYLESH